MIIYLNGASSSGKTSIALALQRLIPQPVFYFSVDTLLYTLAPEILESIQGKSKKPVSIRWGDVFEGYFECVAVLQLAGNTVIADCPVYSEALQELFLRSLGGEPDKFVVGVNCPLKVLETRERLRKDRTVGLAKQHFSGIHKFLEYDLKVESSKNSPEEIAKLIKKSISTK